MIPRKATVLDALFPNFDRLLFGGMYLPVGAVLNLLWGVSNPAVYGAMAENALIPFYRDFMMVIVPSLGVVFPLAVVVFQILVGLMIFYKGKTVRAGFALSILFQFALAPIAWWGFLNILLGLAQLPLLVYEFESAVWERHNAPVLRQL